MEKFLEAGVRKCPLFLRGYSTNAKIIDPWCLACNLTKTRCFLTCVHVKKQTQTFLRSSLGKATISPAHYGRWNWFHYWRRWGFKHIPYAVLGPAQKRLRGAQRTTVQNSRDVNFQNWKARPCQGKCPSRSAFALRFWSFVYHYSMWDFYTYNRVTSTFFFPLLLGDQLLLWILKGGIFFLDPYNVSLIFLSPVT